MSSFSPQVFSMIPISSRPIAIQVLAKLCASQPGAGFWWEIGSHHWDMKFEEFGCLGFLEELQLFLCFFWFCFCDFQKKQNRFVNFYYFSLQKCSCFLILTRWNRTGRIEADWSLPSIFFFKEARVKADANIRARLFLSPISNQGLSTLVFLLGESL